MSEYEVSGVSILGTLVMISGRYPYLDAWTPRVTYIPDRNLFAVHASSALICNSMQAY